MRPEEQSEKTERCRKNLWNEIQLKDRNRHQKEKEKKKEKVVGQARLVYVRHKP